MKKVPWAQRPRAVNATLIGACAALLILFAILSYSAVLTKSATYDEPLHAVAGYVHRTMGDFRINPEDPALFGYWSSIPHGKSSIQINTDLIFWDKMLGNFAQNQWPFVVGTLYRTPGIDGDAFIQRSRVMFVLVGVALGALIAWWSWQLAGAWAALAATALFALDPNFMAHSAMVKNDVMLSLVFGGLALALWRFGRRGTWLSACAIAIACAAGVNVKFSGVLAGPLVLITLMIRALLPQDWNVIGFNLATRGKRLIVVPAVCLLAGIVTYVAIWACYDFRFAPTKDPNQLLNTQQVIDLARINHLKAANPETKKFTKEQFDETRPGKFVDVLNWMVQHRLFPQAWLHGFMFTYATTLIRSTFLLETVRITGRWYYFPCAILFKTPTATLAAIPLIGLAMLVLVLRGTARKKESQPSPSKLPMDRWWSLLCLALPVLVYMFSAMSTNLNLGLRHILPVYPFGFIALSLGFTKLLKRSVQLGAAVGALVLLGLAIESFAAYPDYLAFFNAPSGGSSGGMKLLGDSNLDWGQDLKLLASWRADHTDKPMYLSYFGVADPKAYHVDAIHVPIEAGGWPFTYYFPDRVSWLQPGEKCYFAISATNLQCIYIEHPQVIEEFNQILTKRQPLAVLGGSIYIYEMP